MTTIEDRRAEERERDTAKREEMRQRHPTEHPHLLTIALWQGPSVKITCPGMERCSLWYGTRVAGKCGLQTEFEELGSEMLEYQVGPEFTPVVNPFPIGFTWTGGGEDDPPEIEWWPL